MKKTFALITLVAASVTCASAQMWVGGSLEYGNKHSEVQIDVLPTCQNEYSYNSFTICPEVGCDLNERWSLALGLMFSHGKKESKNYYDCDWVNTYVNIPSTSSTTSNSFSIEPYVRYHALEWGKLGMFVDGGVSYGFSHINGSGDTSNDFMAFVRPGLSFRLNERFALVSSIGALKYAHSWYDEGNNTSDIFNFGLSSSLLLGFYVYLK